jgi:PKD repeat protein
VTFSTNGNNAAKNTTATFTKAGTYNFLVTATNAAGFSATSTTSVTIDQMPKNIAIGPGGGAQFTVTGTDQFGNALPSSPAFAWPAAGLTLQLAADGYLHLYQSGATTDLVPPYAEAGLNSVAVTGLDGAGEALTVDLSGGMPIPAGGIAFNGGTGGGNSLYVIGTSGGDNVVMSAAQITANGLAPIYYSNVTYFGFNLAGGSNSLTINNATLKINQDNAISAGTNVTINAGVLDLNGHTDVIGDLVMTSGSIIDGALYANAYNIESGAATASIAGPGDLLKTTGAEATTGAVNVPNVTVDAGQLTVTSIFTDTLTVGPGAALTIAPIADGPLGALAADNALASLAGSALPPNQDNADTQPTVGGANTLSLSTAMSVAEKPLVVNTIVALSEALSSNAALLSAPSDSALDPVCNPVAVPAAAVADMVPRMRPVETAAAGRFDAELERIVPQAPISSRLNPTALPRIIANWLEIPPAARPTSDKTPTFAVFHEESPARASIIEKHAYVQATGGRQACLAALHAIMQDSRWVDTDAATDSAIIQHVRARKRQFEKATDGIFAEEDDALLAAP